MTAARATRPAGREGGAVNTKTPDEIHADVAVLIGMYEDGKAQGRYEGREDTREDLQPYVQHIGNCGAAGSDPEDSRCICGLRQIWMALEILR